MSVIGNIASVTGSGLTDGWEWSTLGEVSEKPQYGWTTKANHDTGNLKLLRTTDITSGTVDWSTVPYCTEEPEDIGKYLVESGDILISRAGSVGVSFLISKPERAVFASYLIRFRPKKGIDTKYFYYYLKSPAYWEAIGASKSGIAVPNVNASKLALVPIPVAPLDQQKRIVAEIEKQFSRLDEAVMYLKRVKANLKRYKAAVLKAAVEGRLVETEAELARREGRSYDPANELRSKVEPTQTSKKRAGRLWGSGHVPALTEEESAILPEGWAWVKVRDIGYTPEDAVQVGPMSMKSSEFTPNGVPILNVGCVQWGYFDETKLDHLPEHLAAHFQRYRIQPGDVLFTRSGTVGRCAVAKDHQRDWLMTFHLLRARPDSTKCLPEYLRAVFEGARHIRRQTREASIGSTRAGFNTNLLAMLDVPLPPMAEQRRIMAEVDRRLSLLRKIEAQVDANLQRAERLRQSILIRAFSGGLLNDNQTISTGAATAAGVA